MSQVDFDEAMRIEAEVWRQAPRRAAVLCLIAAALFAAAALLTGCGLVAWDNPGKVWGPKQTFERLERASGGD